MWRNYLFRLVSSLGWSLSRVARGQAWTSPLSPVCREESMKWNFKFRGCPLLRGDKCTITMGSGAEVVLFSEVTNVLSLWEVGQRLSSSQRWQMYYHYGKWGRGCPLLRGDKCTITMGSGAEVVLFSEVTNVLSLWEVGQRLSSSQRWQMYYHYGKGSSVSPGQ